MAAFRHASQGVTVRNFWLCITKHTIKRTKYTICKDVTVPYCMKLDKHFGNDIFGAYCRLVVLVFNPLISANDVIKRYFNCTSPLKLLKHRVQMKSFKLGKEIFAKLSGFRFIFGQP